MNNFYHTPTKDLIFSSSYRTTGPGRILAKCEFMNPGGSIKDRSSLGMIRSAIEAGDLKPNGPVLEGMYEKLLGIEVKKYF